ncbi:MAG: SGNH/GDSL hydrolase family protein [Clostridia bacterium]|nr:SGNH/GDSL hydrolase family protein [Clostridia bacterium]
MTLTGKDLKPLAQGATDVVEHDGYLRFLRFTEGEASVIDSPNLLHPAGVQLEFKTDGTQLRLGGRTIDIFRVRSYYAIDVLVNGTLIGYIGNLKDEDATGNYAWRDYPNGHFLGDFSLGKGEKTVRIVLPHSTLTEFLEVTIEGATYITPVKREKTLLVYGDSITQGYDALHPSATYAVRLADAMGATLYNKAIGGAQFAPAPAEAPAGVKPDIILVAYGTNDWTCRTREELERNTRHFFETLTAQQPGIPIYAITPIWRKECEVEKPFGSFADLATMITEICAAYPTVRVINGFDLVPHEEQYFGDLCLHPNDAGFAEYAASLLKELENRAKL